MPVIINRSGRDLRIPEIQKIIPCDGKQYEVSEKVFIKYRNFFEHVQVELQEKIKVQENIIKELKRLNILYDIFKVCQIKKTKKKFDFLYSFYFNEDIEPAIQRLKISIRSIIEQNVTVCICNTSEKDIKEYLLEFDKKIKYRHLPQKDKIYCKSKIINYGVENLVSSEYFFLSDIDLVYPPNFINFLSLFTEVKYPVRIIFSNYNLKFSNPVPKNYDQCKKNYEKEGGLFKFFAPGNGMIHLSSFKKIAGFDERFIGYGSEDSEFNYRISKINKYYKIDLEEVNTFHLFHKTSMNLLEKMTFNEQMWRYIMWKGETENLSLIRAGEIQFPKDLLEKDWSLEGREFV